MEYAPFGDLRYYIAKVLALLNGCFAPMHVLAKVLLGKGRRCMRYEMMHSDITHYRMSEVLQATIAQQPQQHTVYPRWGHAAKTRQYFATGARTDNS